MTAGKCRPAPKVPHMAWSPISTQTKRFGSLEGLRAIAALLVVMYHLQDIVTTRFGMVPFGGLFGAGDRGVDLFFVLSGFIIMITHTRDIGRPRRCLPYIYKRVCRIFPGVWVLTAFAAVTYEWGFGGITKAATKLNPWNMVASFALLPQNAPPLVNVTWTLTYEIFFYGLFALIIVRPKPGLVLILMWQATVALSSIQVLRWNSWVTAYYFRPICMEFGIGILCAMLVSSRTVQERVGSRHQSALLGLGLGVFVTGSLYEALILPHGLESVRVVVFGLSAGCIIVALTLREDKVAIRVPAALLLLGEASFAIYLVHYSVITFAASILHRLPQLPITDWILSGCAVLGVMAGGAFHLCVDRPIQSALRGLGRRLFETASRQPVYNAAQPSVVHAASIAMVSGRATIADERSVQ